MESLLVHPYVLAAIFFLVAYLYSSVGLAGGSSYTAILAISGASPLLIPTVSLSLNILVSTIGSFNYIRYRHARIRLIAPFFVTSIPMSYVGGSLQLPKDIFLWVLLVSLFFVAVRIYLVKSTSLRLQLGWRQKIMISLFAGAVLGLIAGIVGIGGGVYLVPLIIILGLGSTKEAAAAGVLFIFVNSVSGLFSRFQHGLADVDILLPLAVAVILGGTLGSYHGASRLKPEIMEKFLGLVIIVAIGFLLRKLLFQ